MDCECNEFNGSNNVTIKELLKEQKIFESDVTNYLQQRMNQFQDKLGVMPCSIYLNLIEISGLGDDQRTYALTGCETKFDFME